MASSSYPSHVVYQSEHNGAKLAVMADSAGLRLASDAGDLLIMDWPTWLLMQTRSAASFELEGVYLRAIAAIPPIEDDDLG